MVGSHHKGENRNEFFFDVFCFLRCFTLSRRERSPIYLDLCVNCAWILILTIPIRSRFRRSLWSLHTKANVRKNKLNQRKTSMSSMVHKFHTYFDVKTFL